MGAGRTRRSPRTSRACARGVDSTAGAEEAVAAARELAQRTGAVVAVSGAVDHVTDGRTVVTIPGGDVLLTRGARGPGRFAVGLLDELWQLAP